jgi:ribose-phosphate pyrophosphokinase
MTEQKNVKIIPRGGVSFVCSENMLRTALAAQARLEKRGVHNVTVQELDITRFLCGEVKIKIAENVRGKEVFLFYGFTNGSFNDEIMTLYLTLNALDKADCKRTTLVLPFFPYTRQDRKDESRVPLSARALIDMLCLSSSFERIITIDLHAEQLESAFPAKIKMDHLPGSLLVARWLREQSITDLVVVSPDVGSAKRIGKLADLMGPGTATAIFDKKRNKDGSKMGAFIGEPVAGKTCLLNDDMIDTGGTVVATALKLHEDGASRVIISATHPVFSPNDKISAYDKLATAKAEVVVTDSLTTETHPWLTVIPIGKLMGDVIFENITLDGSVSKIINGE